MTLTTVEGATTRNAVQYINEVDHLFVHVFWIRESLEVLSSKHLLCEDLHDETIISRQDALGN